MNLAKQITVILTLLAAAVTGRAAPEAAEPVRVRLALDLVDGSYLLGTPAIESVAVQTAYAKMDVPLKFIQTIKFEEDHQAAVLDLKNGDKLKGVIKLESLRLDTIFGHVAVAEEHIRLLRVVLSGGTLPLGEGPLAFGGLNWIAWRTQFEVQDDKLVSLPGARPGFNYGHGGNGRGATLATNIGNADWKDYRVEFELAMGGVDPAFNPHGLGQDYRAASIGFHVADAKESWNQRGSSSYAFNLGGDGSWGLSCSYNSYCNTPCGYGNPACDATRALTEGKGLKPDLSNGNKIRIEVSGTHIQVWFDGERIADVRDEKMTEPIGGQTLDHGGISVMWGFESMGWIRNFSAKRL